jgi:hypothetical protein
MERLNLCKVITVVGILVMVSYIYGGIAVSAAEKSQAVVNVTLQSGETLKFEYDSFEFDWIFPPRIKEPISCQEYELEWGKIREIYFSGEFDNICENKKDWQVIVALTDEKVFRGFLHVSKFAVKGIRVETGEEKSISFKDLKQIKFRR